MPHIQDKKYQTSKIFWK